MKMAETDFGFHPSLARWDCMDQIAQHLGMLVAEAASAVDHHNWIAVRCYIVAVALDILCYIATGAAAVAQCSPFDKNSDIGRDSPVTAVVPVLVPVHTRLHLPGLRAAGQIHSRVGTVVQAEVGHSSPFHYLQTFSLQSRYEHMLLGIPKNI